MDAETIIACLSGRKMSLATAESCTGGMLAAALTSVPGSSACFGYGVVTYSNEAKQHLLQVPDKILAGYGAVSAQTAMAMARGLSKLSGADISLAITGIAGPGGGSEEKPVGLVYLGLCAAGKELTEHYLFNGTRREVREQSVAAALNMIGRCLAEDKR